MSFRFAQTVIRTLPGSYVNGVWVPGGEVPEMIYATIQPLSDQDLINLPAGRRASDMVKVYTKTRLTTVEDAGENKQPDKILWDGDQYEITAIAVRQMRVIPHFRYWATKIPVENSNVS